MSQQFAKRKQGLGLTYGLISGIAFSIAAWGIDSIALANAHVSYAWIKFLPGLLLASFVGGLVGWASSKISKGLVTVLLWLFFGLFLVWLTAWLPFVSTPSLLKALKPDLVDWIDYPMVLNIEQFRVVAGIVIVFPAIICGLLENNVIEAVLLSSHKGTVLSVILVCGFLMGIAGFAGDELFNKHFREPIKVLDNLFEFAVEHQGQEINDELKRRLHLSTVKGLEDILPRSRKLTLIAYDESLAQMDILVDFEGIWVKCSTIYSQPTMCEQVQWAPINLYYLRLISLGL